MTLRPEAAPPVFLLIFCSLLCGLSPLAKAQDVVLNPGYVSGQVQVGSEAISRVKITASNDAFSATMTVNPAAGSTSATYTLTVNVPEGTVQTYELAVEVRTDDNIDLLRFPGRSVDVTEFQTTAADFVLAAPGILEGAVEVTGGGSLDYAGISVNGTQPATTSTRGDAGGAFRFPVFPASGFRLSCNATLIGGLRSSRTVYDIEVGAGQTRNVSCEVFTPSGEKGIVFGTAAMPGPVPVQRHHVQAGGGGPNGNLILSEDGPFSFELTPGKQTLRVTTRFNNNRQQFRHPLGSYTPLSAYSLPQFDIVAGEALQVDVESRQALVNGRVKLTGPPTMPSQPSQRSITAHGVFDTPTFRGWAWENRNRPAEDYQLVLSEGPWDVSTVQIWHHEGGTDPLKFLDSSFTLRDAVARENPLILGADSPGTREFESTLR